MLNKLAEGIFFLQDFDATSDEIPLITKFLQTKTALTLITGVEISLKPGIAPENRRRKPHQVTKKITKSSEKDGSKLLFAVIEFIKDSTALESLEFDNVTFPNPDMISKLGESINHSTSPIRFITFSCCPLNVAGCRSLCPAITSCSSTLNSVTLHKCELNNECVPFIISIIKAGEASMDQLYWNSTLRMNHGDNVNIGVFSDETNHVYSSGLIVLDISGNSIDSQGLVPLNRQLKHNYWLLALNVSNNLIDESGFILMEEALASNDNLGVSCFLMKENPGFTTAIRDKLYRTVSMGNSRIAVMPDDLYAILKDYEEKQSAECAIVVEDVPDEIPDASDANGNSEQESDELAYGTDNDNTAMGALPPSAPQESSSNTNKLGRGDSVYHDPELIDQGVDDSLEFAIPTPGGSGLTDDETQQDFLTGSPTAHSQSPISSGQLGGYSKDGRPPSRNSMRPRGLMSNSLPLPVAPKVGKTGTAGTRIAPTPVLQNSISPQIIGSSGEGFERKRVNHTTRDSQLSQVRSQVAFNRNSGDFRKYVQGMDASSLDMLADGGFIIDNRSSRTSSRGGTTKAGKKYDEEPTPRELVQARHPPLTPFYPGGSSVYDKARKNSSATTRREFINDTYTFRAYNHSSSQTGLNSKSDFNIREPFYPSGKNTTYAATREAAAAAKAMHEHLKSFEGVDVDDLFGEEGVELFRNSPRRVTKKKKKKLKRRRFRRLGGAKNGESRLDKLTAAMETMSQQLADTNERLMDVTETLSDSFLSGSMNSGHSGTYAKHSPSKDGSNVIIGEGDLASSNTTAASTRYDNKLTSPDDTEKEVRFSDITDTDCPFKKKSGKGSAIKEGMKSKMQDLKQKN